MKNLSKYQIIREVVNRLDDHYHPDSNEWLNTVYNKIFKVMVDEFGARNIAEMITDHPNKGYFVRYVDNKSPELIAQMHKIHIKETEETIKALYD